MLGVCCEFGMGTEQDVARAEQLYKCGAEQGNATAKLLTGKLKNKKGRGCTQMNLECEPEKTHEQSARFVKSCSLYDNSYLLWCLGRKGTGLDVGDARAACSIKLEL